MQSENSTDQSCHSNWELLVSLCGEEGYHHMAQKRKEAFLPDDDGKQKKIKLEMEEPAEGVRVKEDTSIHAGAKDVRNGEEDVPDLMDIKEDGEEPVEEENEYEQERARIVEENRIKMQKLGLMFSTERTTKRIRARGASCKSESELPPRRSGRFVAPHNVLPRAKASCANPYHQTHNAAEDQGKRIYDSELGRTCHQCRQKTLGPRTSCAKCKARCGQFCTECLRSRYGEKLSDATSNKNWDCPVCRGICNCSICRNKRGLAATGQLYPRVLEQGYKSVAHYLLNDKGDQPIFLKSPSGEHEGEADNDDAIQPATPSPQQRPPRGNHRRSESVVESCSLDRTKKDTPLFLRPVRRSLRLTSQHLTSSPESQPGDEWSRVSEKSAAIATTAGDSQCTIATANPIVKEENTDTTVPLLIDLVKEERTAAPGVLLVELEDNSTENVGDWKGKALSISEPIYSRLRKKKWIDYKKFL
ncbi:hypothetical protein Mapa_013373 [Marchantia paleacea]|nr:hypothetical protein Mapa_013373 [Marchantia paleacea]